MFEFDIWSYVDYIDFLQADRASLCFTLNASIYIVLGEGAGILACSSATGRLILPTD